jgi:hypothetical protein
MDQTYEAYINKFNSYLRHYFPPKDTWTPADEAIFKPLDLFRIPLKEASDMQFRSIKWTFNNQYQHNKTYQNFCKKHNFSPSDLKTNDDLDKIPLIPDSFFKAYPQGRDFAVWLENIYTGTLPIITIKEENPTFDDVINAFNKAGMAVTYSSGTSGRYSFIPRDLRTFNISQYSAAKSAISMIYPIWNYDIFGYITMPNPRRTNIFAGKAFTIFFDVIHDIRVAIDREITTEHIQLTMSGNTDLKTRAGQYFMKRETEKIINTAIKWLEEHDKKKEKILMAGAPFLISFIMQRLEKQGRSFDFGERGAITTGGGWKTFEDQRIPATEFRNQSKRILGIPEKYCIDTYGMAESNGWMVQCPEGHYLHVPYSFYKGLVLGKEFKPIGYGEWGRFAFLDAAGYSYPGFIISGDTVRMLEHCPACDRPGPVLEPEVKRAAGEDIRGCAEEVSRMLSVDLSKN